MLLQLTVCVDQVYIGEAKDTFVWSPGQDIFDTAKGKWWNQIIT
jgi:hypothetical protein